MSTTDRLRAYFYLLEGETPPDNAPDTWFLPRVDPAIRSMTDIQTFEAETRQLVRDLDTVETEQDIQAAFYTRAKAAFGTEKAAIRDYFRLLYLLIFRRPHGARWGQFVILTGKTTFQDLLLERLENPL